MAPILRRLEPALVGPLVACVGLATGCVEDDPSIVRSDGGLVGEIVVEGLVGPTQLIIDDDGSWLVAQLAGGENDGTGQVVRLDPDELDTPPVVILGGLDKPTGVALFDGDLWVMERNRLTRGSVDGAADGADRVVVADDLPSNGRSEGTLTVDGDRLLYDTSGALEADGTPAAGSGILFAVTIDDDGAAQISEVATGFKHAYAHARTDDGALYTTEIGDGRYDGERPLDELVSVTEGADHGWPRCVGDNRPAVEYGGTDAACADVPRSLAVFPAGATPTSVVASPWNPEVLLVALWNEGEVVAVSATGGDSAAVEVVYSGAAHPQHLTVDGDRVLLTDHVSGRIVALRENSE